MAVATDSSIRIYKLNQNQTGFISCGTIDNRRFFLKTGGGELNIANMAYEPTNNLLLVFDKFKGTFVLPLEFAPDSVAI